MFCCSQLGNYRARGDCCPSFAPSVRTRTTAVSSELLHTAGYQEVRYHFNRFSNNKGSCAPDRFHCGKNGEMT